MGCLFDIGGKILSKLGEYALEPVCRYLGIWQVFTYERNLSKFNEELKELTSRRDTMKACVGEAERQGEEIHNEVKEWLSTADRFISGQRDTATLINNENCEKARFSSSNFPDLCLRCQISRQAEEIADGVSKMRGI